ncbi:hypothetical protein MOV66_19915 [Agrobacterium sp. SHOUNA12C]|uniref:hypothetical protein n=1 Tax=Rhizobium rhizogenes TaxID=359 RepID=UPI001573CB04|nr:hypothetical protein [Rhizobium rhizogenes]MCJ9722116.1 hypothetical protein [Agrobacterium sp. BETTINA12B]MCJ9758923.1 hypothetical protein [Agrobacterium sp. SHOUNA12C]MDJ1636738.1 hypothetical protein [Rhizobium rhizogenes]NTF83016.1 hypothetical protein [Rhizobium rhizogenes]NTG62320.1 hypothetical protein [Rhizobium rhizogenes]
MITVFAGRPDDTATETVAEAFRRSVTRGLVTVASDDPVPTIGDGDVYVFISPRADQAPLVAAASRSNAKVLLFGRLPDKVASLAGLAAPAPLASGWADAAACPPTPIYTTTRSSAVVSWNKHPLANASPFSSRPFLRFDYADEWNNLGYGRITADAGPWSVAMTTEALSATTLAVASAPGVAEDMPFVTLLENETASILWWNRPVGPVDSAEWAVIEAFLADWRHEDRPCIPVIGEIPHGYDAAVTMRLDCDEDIASARPLFELYRARGLPFSVAIKTAQEDKDEHVALMKEVLDAGGAVLSHSVTHAPRWGGSGEACEIEARTSSDWLEQRLPGLTVRYAVSPFHQNPAYVPEALKRAGLQGFVGGIIANDPEMLMAKGGTIPGDRSGVVTHSQQCMLHGDCILREGDPLAINKQAFTAAVTAGNLFGYLDHPFSPRYDYGWGSEEHRLSRHREFIDHIELEMAGRPILWLNEEDTLDWIAAKMRLTMRETNEGFGLTEGTAVGAPSGLAFSVRWRGATVALADFVDG